MFKRRQPRHKAHEHLLCQASTTCGRSWLDWAGGRRVDAALGRIAMRRWPVLHATKVKNFFDAEARVLQHQEGRPAGDWALLVELADG